MRSRRAGSRSATTTWSPRRAGSSADEAELWARCRAGDQAARGALVELWWNLLGRIANKLHARLPAHVDLEELVAAGSLGLLDAVDRYDPARASFKTFAAQRIKGAILDFLRDSDRSGRLSRNRAKAAEELREELAQVGLPASPLELAAGLGLEPDQFARFPDHVSLAEPSPDGRRVLGDFIRDPRAQDPGRALELAEEVDRIRKLVRGRHAWAILEASIGREETLLSISERLGLSESRVCQIRTRELGRLGGVQSPGGHDGHEG